MAGRVRLDSMTRYPARMTATLAAWLHDLDPFLVQFPQWFPDWFPEGIRWYGLSYAVGFVIGYLLILRVARVGISPLKADRVGDFIIWAAVGVIVGGRLGYVLFYDQAALTEWDSDQPPWWGVLMMNRGGMSSHGGIIGSIAMSLAYAHRHRISKLFILDVLAFGAPLGLGLGRVANFINGELYGRPIRADSPLAVKFPSETIEAPEVGREAYWAVVDATGKTPDSMHAIIEAIQNGNGRVIEVVEPLLTPRHPSQLYAAVLEGLCVFIVLAIAYRRPRRAGVVGSLFCIGYAVARIFGEFFRMPDAHILNEEFARFGVSRGQWLSVLLLGAGLFGLWLSRATKAPVLGGWQRRGTAEAQREERGPQRNAD